MESIFLKVVISVCIFVYVVLYYEEIVEFAQMQTYGNEAWLNISQQPNCQTCPNENKSNCYSNPSDSSLCGKCFETCLPQIKSDEKRPSPDPIFALAASQNDVNKLLVLIASIHRHFPKTKVLIFDKDNSAFLQNQLISIRNVEVVRLQIPAFNTSSAKRRFLTPFYLQESLKRSSIVAWLTPDVEFHNAKYIGFGSNLQKYPVIYISRDTSRKITTSGYRQYFPSTSVSPNFPLSVILRNDQTLDSIIKWLQKCSITPECWKCENSKSESEDCTWHILHYLSSQQNVFRRIEDPSESLQKQSWSPPDCDLYCALYLIVITTVVVLSVGALALVLFQRATKKKL